MDAIEIAEKPGFIEAPERPLNTFLFHIQLLLLPVKFSEEHSSMCASTCTKNLLSLDTCRAHACTILAKKVERKIKSMILQERGTDYMQVC